jgi:23S rRNA (uracil1939-C5)-methyltransferase
VPGDRVRAVVGKAKRAYAEARAVEILEPSPERIEPVADHPGAPWQVLPYERQLAVKQEQVDDALTRIGRLEGYELAPIVPALEQWRYRNKLEYSFG